MFERKRCLLAMDLCHHSVELVTGEVEVGVDKELNVVHIVDSTS